MKKISVTPVSVLWTLLLVSTAAGADTVLSEQDYFSELPAVLTVTRLAQPLSETPGAVTLIDREAIRRSGAREVIDVLRLVPGYLIGGINGAHQSAAYHAPLDHNGVRNLVLIDGRPAYNSFYLGDTHRSLMSVLLEDIERIEVLRGSNSAAYGANAMFGVINIITRHAADTHGAEIAVTSGSGGIADGMARIGWGSAAASFRLSAGRRQDHGYRGAYDDRRADQMHFRGDFRPASDEELLLTAGATDLSQAEGQGTDGDPFRKPDWRENYFHAQWRRQLSATDEIKVSASHDQTRSVDATPYAPDPSVVLDFGGKSRKTNLELQHQIGLGSAVRAVWGAGYERNSARSAPLFAQHGAIVTHEERLFGNLEWRPHALWLINAGGYWNRHSWTGSSFSPRLMANFHATPDHALRAGVSESVRTPNIFELAADVRYYPKNINNLPASEYKYAPYAFFNIPVRTFAASGNVGAERLKTQELGYFGNLRDWRLTLDVRAYRERMTDRITDVDSTIPGYVNPINLKPLKINDFDNAPAFRIRGVEYQLRWKPLASTEIWLNQTFQTLSWDTDRKTNDANRPPTHATTLALFQKLPHNLDFALMLHSIGAMTWSSEKDGMPARRRVDGRLALPFSVGSTRVEAAVTVQAMNGGTPEYLYRWGYESERRAFGSLRLTY